MNFSIAVIADRTAIIKPKKADTIWMNQFMFSGIVDIKAKMDARIPEMGCVIC